MNFWVEVFAYWLAVSVIGTIGWAFVVSRVKRWNRPEDTDSVPVQGDLTEGNEP